MTCLTCGTYLHPINRVRLAHMWVWFDHCGTRGCPNPRYVRGRR